jgi:hypothetical protein
VGAVCLPQPFLSWFTQCSERVCCEGGEGLKGRAPNPPLPPPTTTDVRAPPPCPPPPPLVLLFLLSPVLMSAEWTQSQSLEWTSPPFTSALAIALLTIHPSAFLVCFLFCFFSNHSAPACTAGHRSKIEQTQEIGCDPIQPRHANRCTFTLPWCYDPRIQRQLRVGARSETRCG